MYIKQYDISRHRNNIESNIDEFLNGKPKKTSES